MMKWLFFLPIFSTILFADLPPLPYSDNSKIAFQNSILCKVNSNTISMLDVKKKMDILFHEHYPQLADSPSARCQFYEMSWRHVLSEMIDHELMLSDATDKEVKLTDGEVREELESRLGPNVMVTLDKIGLTYDEAWKMIKNDLLVRRMSWWFIHSKAMQQVTPQDIRLAYRTYLKENPPYKEWRYRILAIRGENPEEKGKEIYKMLVEGKQSPEFFLDRFDESVQLSNEYLVKDSELSEVYRTVLASLQSGEYSLPVVQVSRADKKMVGRIFYLAEVLDHPAPQFEEISSVLQNDLTQKAIAKESDLYFSKLRKHYGFDGAHLLDSFPEDFHPFSLE